jgi:hypothetical protein
MRGSAYAGVGSRVTPLDVCAWMSRIARVLAERCWTVRTGGSNGADEAFCAGAGPKQRALYLPHPGWNGWPEHALPYPSPRAFALAALHHPRWAQVSESSRDLLARTSHVIMGSDLASPAAFVLCWTPTRDLTAADTLRPTSKAGGTGQAIRIADAHRIPIWNLSVAEHAASWKELTS